MWGCFGRCRRRTTGALNDASRALTGRQLIHMSKQDEALLTQEHGQRAAKAKLNDEKELAAARNLRKQMDAQAAAAKANREKEEKEEADAAAEKERQELEARKAREALQAEVGELEKAIAQLERDEQKASAAVDAARKELGGIAPEDRENADAVVKSKQRVLDKIKAKKEGLEGSLAILKKKSQGGKRFTRRRKTRRRR
jgi:hypothetical protein